MFYRKSSVRLLAGIVCFFMVIEVANAWLVPALGVAGRFLSGPITNTVIWAGSRLGANPGLAKGFEWSLAINGAVFGTTWFGDPLQKLTEPIKAKIMIPPNKDQPTANPDPKQYSDAPQPTDPLQPTPKDQFVPTEGNPDYPSNFPAVVQSVGGAGQKTFNVKNANGIVTGTVDVEVTTAAKQGATSQWQGGVTINGTTGYYWVYTTGKVITCPTGYTLSNGACNRTVPVSEVQKPAGTVSCEVIRKSDGTWYIDPKNPECAALQSSSNITTTNGGKTVKIDNGNGQKLSVTDNDDGTRQYDLQDGSKWRTIKTGPYDPGLDGRQIQSIQDGSGTTNPNAPTPTNPGGTGTGTGTGTGSGGSCGGTGQPSCSIDDAGFDGKATDGDGLGEKVDAHDTTIKDKIAALGGSDKHGMDWTWTPSIPRVQCQPYEFGTGTRTMSVDLCGTFEVIRQALGWLLYIMMAWGLFDLLLSGTTSKGRK